MAEQTNPMRELLLDKVVVNLCVGESGERHKKALTVIEQLTGQRPTVTYSEKTIKNFGIRKGEAIGGKVTLRGENAMEFLKRALVVKENKLKKRQVGNGEFSFGIEEHIDLPGVTYDPDIGMYGMDVSVLLKRKGFRVNRRKIAKSKIGKNHRITRDETVDFLRTLGVEVE
jgi:large subunit ribosomal protein L5